MLTLRPYQQEAKKAILGEWDKGVQKTLLVLPTGTGKTIVFASVAKERVQDGRVLILAHRGELLEQAADKLKRTTGLECSVEKAEQTSIDSWHRVTVGSVQTLMRESRLDRFAPDHFGTIIVDEAHHAISDSYQRILQYFSGANVLGVTATPDRGDKRNLGSYFESLAYEYSLPEAIREGYLSPIKALTIPLTLDLRGVRQQSGDYRASDLDRALAPYLEQIADEMVTYAKDRKTVVFLPLIATSQHFTELLCERGFRAAEINGESTDRAEKLAAFDRGEYDVLCNSMLLTEGWDCPSVDCIVVLRPTKIRSHYSQMVGRGTRVFPNKDHLLLLDFLWHTDRHDLVHPAHLIAQTEEIADKMTDRIQTSSGAVDIIDAEQLAERDVMAEREASLARELEQMRHRKRKLVDPVQYALSINSLDLADYLPTFAWEMKDPTDKQLHALEQFGVSTEGVDCAGKASLIISVLVKRAQAKLSTPKQIRYLERQGFHHVGEWTMHDASDMIDQIAQNGWQVPSTIDPASFAPDYVRWTA